MQKLSSQCKRVFNAKFHFLLYKVFFIDLFKKQSVLSKDRYVPEMNIEQLKDPNVEIFNARPRFIFC